MSKNLRTCILALTHNGAGVTLVASKDGAPVIRKGQNIHVDGYGVVKVTRVRNEDATEGGRELTIQWVSFDADAR
jgi:hypothetical protein